MFPSHGDQFGGPFDPIDGPFTGGDLDGAAPFEGAFEPFEGMDETFPIDLSDARPARDAGAFLAVGLHFFERIKGMK
jgi:hypothetical protein